MRIRHCVAVSFGVMVVGVVACGGGPSASCGGYFDSLVSYEQKCNPGAQVDTTGKADFQAFCEAIAKAPGANNFSGQLDTCVGLLNGSTCGASINCKIAGSLSDGTACGTAVQCSGGRCDTSGATTVPNSELTCGKCASYVAVGVQCGTGAVCDPGTSVCTNGTCVAYAQQGQSCAAAQCTGGLQCDSQTKTCQPLPTKGAACPQFQCQAPYKCIQGNCGDAVQSGGACPTGGECAGGLTCDQQTKTCKQPTLAPAGQPCGFVQNQIIGCQTGLKCQAGGTGQGTCIAPKQTGDACTVGKGECADFIACINGICGVPDYSVCQ